MDPPPPPKTSPWNLSWKVTGATPTPIPNNPSTSSTIGLGTAQAFASFPELSQTKLTKAQLKAAKKQAPPLPALSTPDLKPITLASIPEVLPWRRSPNRSPVRKSPERFHRRGSPIKRSPERIHRRPYSEVIASPRQHKNFSRGIEKQGESSAAGHVNGNNELSGSLVSVPALPPTQDKAEPIDEEHNAPISLESRTEFPELLQDKKVPILKRAKMDSTTLPHVETNLKPADQQGALTVVPQLVSATMATQGHKNNDNNSTTPPNVQSVDNAEMESFQPNNKDRSHTPPVPPTLNSMIPAQSKVEVSDLAARFTTSNIDNAKATQDTISSSEVQGEDTTISNVDDMKKSEQAEMEANDTEKNVAKTEVSPVLDEIDTVITSLIRGPSFHYEMNSAAQEKIKPHQAQAEGFHFLPLIDDFTYGPMAKTDLNTSTSLILGASGSDKKNRHYEISQSIFPDDPPRRYREVNEPCLKSPEQQEAYDLAVQYSGSGNGKQSRHQGFQSEQVGRGKMVTRRGSISYVVDVSTLQEAVAEEPTLILNRIKAMKEDIEDLRLELQKEAGVRKWTVTQYEALHSISIGKQMLLWEHIGRLQRGNEALLNNQAHGYTQAPTHNNSSPSLSTSELASYVEGQGSELFDGDIERKGTARRNSLESDSKLDPNAQAFVPSERGSPVKTERAHPTHGSRPIDYASSNPKTAFGSHSTQTAVSESANNTSGPSTFNSDGTSSLLPRNRDFNAEALTNFDFETQPIRRGRIIQPPLDAMSPQTFALILASIPRFWRSICPISSPQIRPVLTRAARSENSADISTTWDSRWPVVRPRVRSYIC